MGRANRGLRRFGSSNRNQAMNHSPKQKPEQHKAQPAQVMQSNSGSSGKQMDDLSTSKSTPNQAGQNVEKGKPAQSQQQGKFTPQLDADKNKAAPLVEKGKAESHQSTPHAKDGKSC